MYTVTVDYHSRWINIANLKPTTSQPVIRKIKVLFSKHSIPDTVQSANGPQFNSSDFEKFSAEYWFTHVTSSPLMHQANGLLERAVQTTKKILDNKDVPLALLNYRATRISSTGISPAEALMERRIKTKLPVLPQNLWPTHVERGESKKVMKIVK